MDDQNTGAAAPASLDISSMAVAPEATATWEVIKPDGDVLIGANGQPASITFHPPGSRKFAHARAQQNTRNLRRLRARSGKLDQKAEEQLADTAMFLRDITISFNNFDYRRAQYPQDGAMHFACFADPGMGWLTDGFNSAAGDWGNGTPTGTAGNS